MPQPTTIFEELAAAARGFVALLTGNRAASSHFDFSQRGLAGSFIALLLATIATAFVPMLFGVGAAPGSATRSVILSVLLFGMQLGVIYAVLRAMGRLDGFIPYVVADNWITLFVSAATVLAMGMVGPNDFVLLTVGIVAIVIEVNIARLIVTLAPLQIVMFIGAQFATQFVGVMLLAGLIPGGPPLAGAAPAG